MHALKMNHLILKQMISRGDTVIDATLGNGQDALYLSQLVGETGTLIGFDIQSEAINHSKERLKDFKGNFHPYLKSHSLLKETIDQEHLSDIQAIVYNLGYLPGGDKSITTHFETVLDSINQGLGIIASKGVISIMLYPGHAAGQLEKEKILAWTSRLNQKEIDVYHYHATNQKKSPPELLILFKK
ncbi:tRNA (mnm(5)s(2)U34)-methyltransferase [Atopobacter phocae]|uniref:tRNA (mnm(5)s(2)U34)-methyltransferase n=1 Tax=Atopobacter phocae TaxID=136492 RepID=UPI0004B9CE5C|nr:class I SAM-dependent methyltransferase [Atopobacter phocae]